MKYSALIGNPVDHSVSPALFSLLAKKLKLEYAHIKMDVPKESDLLGYLKAFEKIGFCGVNVTLPYKIKVMKYLDKLDISAKKIGAVNSIIFGKGRMIGFNTDAAGAMRAIQNQLRPIKVKDKILIIGAGGAARAIIYELSKRSKNIKIVNIDINEAKKTSKDLSSKKFPILVYRLTDQNLEKLINESDLIVNATSVGMYPHEKEEIVKERIFNNINNINKKIFFDAIFNPFYTQFLENAQSRGAKTCSGMYMMIYQAIEALILWTGKKIVITPLEAKKIAEVMKKEL